MDIINSPSNDENNINEIRILYNPTENGGPTNIFGEHFVTFNSGKCKIKANDKLFKLVSYFDMKNTNEIKLIGVNEITDMSYMFHN